MHHTIRIAGLLAALLSLAAGPTDGQTRVDQERMCNAWNGHVTTYDGWRFDEYDAGIWLLTDVQDPDKSFRVEVETVPFNQMGVFRRAAVRCGEHVIVADAGTDRNVVLLDGAELTPGETSFGTDGHAVHLQGSDPEVQLDIQCGDRGASLSTGVWHPGRILTGVRPRLAYYLQGGEPTTGLCGPYDGNQNNDSEQLRGERTQFRIPPEESLFAVAEQQATPPDGPQPIWAHPEVLEFDGTSNLWLEGPFHLTPEFYVRAEVRVDASDQWDHLLEIGSHAHEWNGPMRLEVGDEGEWYMAVGDGAGHSAFYTRGAWTYREWVTVEVEYKGGAIRIWENGEYLGVKQADINVASVGGELNVGSFARGGRHFHGAMRGVMIRPIE